MAFLPVLIGTVLFAIIAPILGCLLAGLDRIISARMQGRVGPPLLQPYYDVRKLIEKDDVTVSGVDGIYMTAALVFTAFAGGIFFSGGNLLMSAFVITMAALFFIMAAFSSRSPFAEVGAGREAIQVMSYEPMVLLMAVCVYMAAGSFMVGDFFSRETPVICYTIPAFIGFLFILTIKLRKSPFDLSTSHHAHQELVRGTTTEMSGKTLAKTEIMHWCETVLFLGWTGMFFIWGNPGSVIIAVIVALAAWFFEIWVDNNFARVKWQAMLKWAWIVALAAGGINIVVLMGALFSEKGNKMGFASKSPWVIHYDASSCNGCDIEVLAALCPGFDVERFGIINTGNPKHADIFLITGSVNDRNISVVKQIYDQMIEPKVVVACGTCACSGGIFHDCYNVLGGADKAIPVDVYAPGCAVRPEAIIDGVVQALGILEEKSKALKAAKRGA